MKHSKKSRSNQSSPPRPLRRLTRAEMSSAAGGSLYEWMIGGTPGFLVGVMMNGIASQIPRRYEA